MVAAKYRAVVFDLFGTLIQNMKRQEFEGILAEIAEELSLSGPSFVRLWGETHEKRSTGYFYSLEEDVDHICRTLGRMPDDEALSGAIERLGSFGRVVLSRYRDDALETLASLKESGYKTGLISNCTAWIPLVWGETPLGRLIDAPVFSCSVGLKKPAKEIYLLASRGVASRPDQCVFVADGNEKELTGASLAGMHPVLFRGPDEDPYDEGRERKEWKGPVVTELKQVLDHVAELVVNS